MSENKTTLPRLRFPEFRKAGAWEEKRLGDVYSFKVTNSFSRDKLNYDHGEVKNIHYGDIHTKFSALFDIEKENVPFINPDQPIQRISEENYCVEGDLVFADASEDLDDVGKCIELVNLNGERVLSGLHTILARQIHSEIIVGFGAYLFASPAIRRIVKRESQGAKVLGISGGRLAGIDIFFPKDKAEQQKIADCLSSLDDLITARGRKVAALERHKKGLMQQLFPATGQTTPQLRFPEFREAGAWEEKRLGDIGKVSMCKRIMKHETKETGDIPFYKIGTFGKKADAYISNEIFDLYRQKYSFPKIGDILISASGTIGRTVVFDGQPAYFQDSNIVWIANDEKLVSNSFLAFIYQKVKWVTDDNTIARLYNDNLRSIEITIPSPPEQQKIAECLTSLDDLIRAEAQKLDALKAHKKGLMQQLFPNPDGGAP